MCRVAHGAFAGHWSAGVSLYDFDMAFLALAQKRQILGKVPLFESLAEADLDAIASVAISHSIKAREELFHQGDEGTHIYVVASGQLKVVTTSSDGDDLIFCLLDPGEVVGELGLLSNRPRTATVTAIKNSELIAIDRRDFQALLRTRPDVAFELLTVLACRLARVSEFVEDTQFLNLPARLAKKLINFANDHGESVSGSSGQALLINVKLSQEEWGDLVGTTRESVNKQFRTWSSDGLISLEAGKVVIHKLDEIEKLAACVVI